MPMPTATAGAGGDPVDPRTTASAGRDEDSRAIGEADPSQEDDEVGGRPALLLPSLLLAATFFTTTLSGALQSPATEGATSFADSIVRALHALGGGVPYA